MTDEKIYDFRCRPIGSDWTPGCFVCGTEHLPLLDKIAGERDEGEPRWLHNNIAAYPKNAEEGAEIVALFGRGAFLDVRKHEPGYVQVKFGACDFHEPALYYLSTLVNEAGKKISARIIHEAKMNHVPAEHLVIRDPDGRVKEAIGEYCAALGVENGYKFCRSKSQDQAQRLIAAHYRMWEEIRRATDVYKIKDQGEWNDLKLDPVRMVVIRKKVG